MTTEFRYPAIRTRQTKSDKRIVTFSANACDIDIWSGVPQKKRFGETAETTGFQREQNQSRISSIGAFCESDDNIIQNPLLCATRNIDKSWVTFKPNKDTEGNQVEIGELIICQQELSSLTLEDCLFQVKSSLEERLHEVPSTIGRLPELKRIAQTRGHLDVEPDPEEDEAEPQEELPQIEGVLFEESHLLDFWEEVAGRHAILVELGDSFQGDEFLGFEREALQGFLKPVVLVDGQHRLLGSLEAARNALNSDKYRAEIETRLSGGENVEMVTDELLMRAARMLPVSLLMSNDPEEQVFQFVVVNQKATPVGKALLGTIVSTTLSNEEMGKVAGRLAAAGIQVEESQAITYLARHPDSPFCNLVERGLAGDATDLLPWSVLGSIIRIFRHLEGGTLFGKRNDFAAYWRNKYLSDSGIVANFEERGAASPYEYWASLHGPWKSVFNKFFSEVRDRFGNVENPERWNFWGKPRRSNLFNKISLTILAADFFQYLVESKRTIESVEDVKVAVDEWLEDVNLQYFDRDWELHGVKKDSSGIRSRWADVWSDYRRTPMQLPDKRLFRSPKKE